MLEIVHDLAPGAALGFATVDPTQDTFAENIRALRFTAHCNIIVDDVIYFAEAVFQDGIVAQAVNDVTADGAIYLSSAGNEGNALDGSSANYEGDFVSSGVHIGKFAGFAHDFDPGPGVQAFEPVTDDSFGLPALLTWADAQGKAKDDYDLYELDADGNVLAFSQDVQNGTQDPFEGFFLEPGTGLRLAVVKFSGAARYFKLMAFRGRFANSDDGLVAQVRPGTTWGHSAAVNAFSVAAAPAHKPLPFDLEPGDPPNPSGPFPNPFTKAQKPERFTSDGPRRVFFNADGSAITPGNFTATGGAVRAKPDITAADGVRTSVAGFDPFFGTSAAAPHAAAVAALVLSGNPGETAAQVRAAFNATALDLTPPGRDNRTGVGIVRADLVLANTGATPQQLAEAGAPTLTVTTGDGDAFFERGETARVSVPVKSTGDAKATGVTVQPSTGDPLATVTPASQSYGSIAVGQQGTRGFNLRLAPTYPKGKPVTLTTTVSFGGPFSPTTRTDRITTGQPGTAVQNFSYTGPAIPIPDADVAGATVPITVSGVGYASRVTFSVDGSRCTTDEGATTVGIDHTFVTDLVGTLTAPDGSSATLFNRSGGDGNNMCKVVFDDAAAVPFASSTPDQAPYTGSWQPATPLSALLGSPVDGTWSFNVADEAALDTGSVRAVSLHVTGFAN
jgi:subtilisin family serine protease/subtilisin-like proprotein convertase family protein